MSQESNKCEDVLLICCSHILVSFISVVPVQVYSFCIPREIWGLQTDAVVGLDPNLFYKCQPDMVFYGLNLLF